MQQFWQRLAADPRAALPLWMWAGLALVDGVVWSRRFAGAMTVPLPAILAVGSTLIVAALAIAALVLWRESDRNWFPRAPWWPELVALAIPLDWGFAVSSGTTTFTIGGLLGVWGMLMVAVGLVHGWLPEKGGCELASDRRNEHGRRESGDDQVSISSPPPPALNPQPSTLDSLPTDWQKRLVVDGRELIEGEAQVQFAAGQKEAVVHLAFCPPLAVVPEVHGEDSLGGELEIRTEAVHTFGARLSVRRREGIDTTESRQISYAAIPPAAGEAAA